MAGQGELEECSGKMRQRQVALVAVRYRLLPFYVPASMISCYNSAMGQLAPGAKSMTRRAVRIAWGLVGLCLLVGTVASLMIYVGPPDQPWHRALQELSTLVDVAALLFWIAIFAIYWSRKRG